MDSYLNYLVLQSYSSLITIYKKNNAGSSADFNVICEKTINLQSLKLPRVDGCLTADTNGFVSIKLMFTEISKAKVYSRLRS